MKLELRFKNGQEVKAYHITEIEISLFNRKRYLIVKDTTDSYEFQLNTIENILLVKDYYPNPYK